MFAHLAIFMSDLTNTPTIAMFNDRSIAVIHGFFMPLKHIIQLPFSIFAACCLLLFCIVPLLLDEYLNAIIFLDVVLIFTVAKNLLYHRWTQCALARMTQSSD